MTPEGARLFAIVCEEREVIRRALPRSGVNFCDEDDACQVAFVSAWKLIQAGRLVIAPERGLRAQVRPWLYRIARSAFKHYAWKQQQDEPHEEVDLEGPDPEKRFEAREELRAIGYRLNRAERALLDAAGRGFIAREIGTAQGVPQATVYTRLRKVRAILRKTVPR